MLKRGYGWGRSRIDGTEGARIWSGHGVLAHNVVKISAPCRMRGRADNPTPTSPDQVNMSIRAAACFQVEVVRRISASASSSQHSRTVDMAGAAVFVEKCR